MHSCWFVPFLSSNTNGFSQEIMGYEWELDTVHMLKTVDNALNSIRDLEEVQLIHYSDRSNATY